MDRTPAQAKSSIQPNQVARIVRALSAGKQIVIAVSRKPTIDQMVAAIGLASLINKQASPAQPPVKIGDEVRTKTKIEPLDIKPDGRAARNAVVAFSGPVHPKIGFLKTDQIITKTVDNYRELVIAIDKNKADKLRYSLDKKMARIHISPFLNNKEGLSVKDLEIGPGDFNIDVLVAVGVNEAGDLEPMIGDNIELLKKRQTITMVADSKPCQVFGAEKAAQEKPAAGSKKPGHQPINWCQPQACCLSEMVFDLAKEMRLELDETIATIILTGFLSATERVKSRTADAEQIGMISQLVKTAGIDNKQMIIDYIENEKLQLPETVAEPARQKAAVKKASTKEQLLTEQEATQRIQESETDSVRGRAGRELGLRVASERRVVKEEKKEDYLIRDLDDIQVDESGQIIHSAAARPAKATPASAEPAASPAKANPVTGADKLGQASPAPAAMPPIQPASSQQYQPSLIPPPPTKKDAEQETDLAAAGQPAA